MDTPDLPQATDPEVVAAQGFTLSRVLALVLALGVVAAILIFREPLVRFASGGYAAYGYLGVFVVSLVSNATILLPVPGLLGVFAGGTFLNPVLTGLVAGVAEPLGELTGYLAGYGGRAVVENRGYYVKLRHWVDRHGFVTILILAAIPNPVFDVAGVMAGALHMPIWRFLLACWLGKTTKALAVAFLGAQSAHWLAPLLQGLRSG